MSKRSRKTFEADNAHKVYNSDISSNPLKRPRKSNITDNVNKIKKSSSKVEIVNDANDANDITDGNSQFECPVCFEEFSSHIFQCNEGHLLCHECHPKFTKCPTCRVSLSGSIRNRALEQIVSSKNKHKKPSSPKLFKCCFCHQNTSKTKHELNNHYHECKMRKIQCPFEDCKWFDSYNRFLSHAQKVHHTCNGSMQSAINHNKNGEKSYTFNHAIKFPKNTLKRANADFVWPKIVRFDDGKEFFILSRYTRGYITVFVRLMQLSKLKKDEINKINTSEYMNDENQLKLNNGTDVEYGDYWIEFRVKDANSNNKNQNNKGNDNDNNNNNGKIQNCHNTPLRWPCKLYGIAVPFVYERRNNSLLTIHNNIFTRFWKQESSNSSAVLRFQFQAIIT